MKPAEDLDYEAARSLLHNLRSGVASVGEVESFLQRSRDVDALNLLLIELPLFGGDAVPYRRFYALCARGLEFDDQDFLKIAALGSLPMVIPNLSEVLDEISHALEDDSAVVRDTAAAAVQIYLGVPIPDVDWNSGNVAPYADELARWKVHGRRSQH